MGTNNHYLPHLILSISIQYVLIVVLSSGIFSMGQHISFLSRGGADPAGKDVTHDISSISQIRNSDFFKGSYSPSAVQRFASTTRSTDKKIKNRMVDLLACRVMLSWLAARTFILSMFSTSLAINRWGRPRDGVQSVSAIGNPSAGITFSINSDSSLLVLERNKPIPQVCSVFVIRGRGSRAPTQSTHLETRIILKSRV